MSNVLVLGSGGREHAIVWSLKNDENVDKVFCAPGNGGTMMHAQNLDVDINDNKDILRIVKNNNIDFTIIGPENPLDNGIVDFLNENGCKVFGPSKYASKLESSKIFARRFMDKYNIPQPCFFECKNEEEVISVATKLGFPIVLKADGLAAGKGVIICYNQRDLDEALDIMFKDRKFGSAANRISVEECLKGQELSIFVVTDGENYKILNSAQDHKRIFDNDEGPNTGGMGAYCPSPLFDEKLREKVENRIIKPTINGMKKEGYPYKGFLYIGIMLVEGEPYMIEYNVRLGDPECQVIAIRLGAQLLDAFIYCATNEFNKIKINYANDFGVTVVMASGGYPNKYETGFKIKGIKDLCDKKDVEIFHSGTQNSKNSIVTSGGRVLSVTARSTKLKKARKKAYEIVRKINWKKEYHRSDIAKKF